MIFLLPCPPTGKEKRILSWGKSKQRLHGEKCGVCWAGMWGPAGWRGLGNEAGKVGRPQLLWNVDGHDLDFGFHSLSHRVLEGFWASKWWDHVDFGEISHLSEYPCLWGLLCNQVLGITATSGREVPGLFEPWSWWWKERVWFEKRQKLVSN